MTLNIVMAVILRCFTEFGRFGSHLRYSCLTHTVCDKKTLAKESVSSNV